MEVRDCLRTAVPFIQRVEPVGAVWRLRVEWQMPGRNGSRKFWVIGRFATRTAADAAGAVFVEEGWGEAAFDAYKSACVAAGTYYPDDEEVF